MRYIVPISPPLNSPVSVGKSLSPTESKILHQREIGLSYKEISARFDMPINTLRTHLHRSFVKLGAHNTTGALWNQRKNYRQVDGC